MSLLTEVGKGLAGQWAERALAPAAVFWAAGLAVSAKHYGWRELLDSWPEDVGGQVAVLVVGLGLVAGSAALLESLAPTILRLAEGYWPWPLRGLRFWLSRRLAGHVDRDTRRWESLYDKKEQAHLEPDELDELVRLDWTRAHFPTDPSRAMPTSVGNLLRAAEDYSLARYGLDAVVCWPRLWLLLPTTDREEIGTARSRLDQATLLWAWGLLFVVFTGYSFWALPTGLGVAWIAWRALQDRAAVFGELLRAAFDVYRFALYDSMGLPRPMDPAGEPAHGEVLTEYLFRGTSSSILKFVEDTHNPE